MISHLKKLLVESEMINIPIMEHIDAITALMIDRNVHNTENLFDFVEREFHATRKWCWKTKQNYLVFSERQYYTLFLLRMMRNNSCSSK